MARRDLLAVLLILELFILIAKGPIYALRFYGNGRCQCNSRLYKPVCGSDGATYLNPCFLECAKMNYPKLLGVCYGQCPCWKPSYRNDVMVTDNQVGKPSQLQKSDTYETASDTSYAGRSTDAETEAGCPCPKIFRPVCGSDNETYANDCLLKCQMNNGSPCLTIACEEECPCPCTCNAPSPSYENTQTYRNIDQMVPSRESVERLLLLN